MSRAYLLGLAEQQRLQNKIILQRRVMRDASDPLSLPETEFQSKFRLCKDAFDRLCRDVIPLLPESVRSTAIRNDIKVLAALQFYSQGSYQRGMAQGYLINMSQTSFSVCLEEVTEALNSPAILLKYIKFPSRRGDRENIMSDFMDKNGMPGVIGCIDGTHVAIIRPQEHDEAYYNRKGYHSLNVLCICDANLTIMHVDASFGGAAHDSFVWNQSPIKPYLERLNTEGEICWLLGDSGFAQKPYMMTPILRATEGSAEDYYTKKHRSARNHIERCFGVLKARWRCLLMHRVLHYNPIKAGRIVNACVVLHNLCNEHNVPVPSLTQADQQMLMRSQINVKFRGNAGNEDARSVLVQKLWAARRH